MTGNAKPRFLWRGWAPAIAIVAITLLSIAGYAFARAQASNATDRAVALAEERIEAEGRRADVSNCTTAVQAAQRSARAQRKLADYIEPLVLAQPPGEDRDQGLELLAVLREGVRILEEPLPCQVELDLPA